MKIYGKPTLKIDNLNRIKEIISSYKKTEINFFFTQQCFYLYGPHILSDIEKITEKNFNIIAEVGENLGLFLSLINLNVRYISISSNIDPIYKKKLISIAKKKKINLLQNEQFRFISNKYNL
mgnify:CR=1 FL=1